MRYDLVDFIFHTVEKFYAIFFVLLNCFRDQDDDGDFDPFAGDGALADTSPPLKLLAAV